MNQVENAQLAFAPVAEDDEIEGCKVAVDELRVLRAHITGSHNDLRLIPW